MGRQTRLGENARPQRWGSSLAIGPLTRMTFGRTLTVSPWWGTRFSRHPVRAFIGGIEVSLVISALHQGQAARYLDSDSRRSDLAKRGLRDDRISQPSYS